MKKEKLQTSEFRLFYLHSFSFICFFFSLSILYFLIFSIIISLQGLLISCFKLCCFVLIRLLLFISQRLPPLTALLCDLEINSISISITTLQNEPERVHLKLHTVLTSLDSGWASLNSFLKSSLKKKKQT